ncbi:MAG: tRNA (adenosine(37)-N6)-threonylcarbamoyltransferase complex ATPase subunit type 1 TsaE [Phycisphaerales bacterium]|nr:tRNA (adenosine(37)-N6)-threonylcarbamoyltransferase complex ATPase subunit type 1 TsaE [Planctomycetota bacterium]
MAVFVRESTSGEYTAALAAGLASVLRGGDAVLLEGDLGAGKTAFVRGLSAALGVERGLVSSPTFVLMNEYPAKCDGVTRVVHMDAYRLRSVEDLDSLGIDEFLTGGRVREGVVLVIEWPERVPGIVSGSAARVRIGHSGETSRQIELELPAEWDGRPGMTELAEREPIRCAVSGAWVSPTSATYPFAGERERMADLYRWFSGSYKLTRKAEEDDFRVDGDKGPD